jgi:hypothetical protein
MKQDGVGVEGYQEKVASDDWGLDFEYDLAEPNPEHDVYIGIQQADDFQDSEDDQGLVDRRGTQAYHQDQQHDHQSGDADEDNEELHQGEYLGGPEVFGGGDLGWGDDRGSDDEVLHRGQEAELSNIFGKRIISKADRRWRLLKSAASSRRVFGTMAELKMLLMDWKGLTRIGGAAVNIQIWTTAHLVYVRGVRYDFMFLYTMVLMLSHAMHVY